ncbi:protein THEMIS2 isoform X2 [Anguilla anguilla]|uniref:protein THEMIS2 isoform X2 n=1 Tax=Anguilla anguilla TaxID=7936 RepID=UPI0015A7DCB0|nr:protein THEMIS2 isoform X2 [Anguilla anguilla]
MDGAGTETMSLQDYITSVDESTLPRILQICSGVYFQGSVYEISGSEVCLSTGDLVKVIGIELQSVTCRDTSTDETSELPLDYAGRFQIVPEDTPFGSIEEMVELIRTEEDGGDAFSFTCPHELELEGHAVPAGELVSLLSVERPDGEGEGEGEELARCRLVGREQEEAGREILVPLSVRGVFYECGSGHGYGVREIVSSPRLRSRHYRRVSAGGHDGPVQLRPVHSVQAIMHLRKNVVQFPSSLEVDLMDVTECCGDVVFVTPRTLAEVAVLGAEALPAVAEVLEAPESARPLFRCRWLPLLRPGQLLVLHGPADPALVLASSFKGKNERRHFLLSRRYGGGFRRRPRNFGSAYELYAAHCRGPGLAVTVTTHWEATADGLTSLSVGDQLEVLGQGKVEVGCRDDGAAQREEVEVLVCRRTSDADEDDEEEEEEEEDGEEGRGEESQEVHLPMYLEGQFVEKLTDTKKRYSLAELGERFSFPLDVKVCRRDPGLEADPLPALSCLQLEQAVSEPAVLASLLEQPELCFLLPVRWLTMTVSFTGDALPEDRPPQPRWETVTEVTDQFYFEFRKLASQDSEAPPPRPPKRRVSTQEAAKAPPAAASNHERRPSKPQPLSQSLDKLNLGSCWPEKGPPPPPPLENADEAPPLIPRKSPPRSGSCSLPNMYTQTPKRNKKKGRRDSDHDYEDIMEAVKNSQESILFY